MVSPEVDQIHDTAQHLIETVTRFWKTTSVLLEAKAVFPAGLLCCTFHSVTYVNTKTVPRHEIAWPHVATEIASALALEGFVV